MGVDEKALIGLFQVGTEVASRPKTSLSGFSFRCHIKRGRTDKAKSGLEKVIGTDKHNLEAHYHGHSALMRAILIRRRSLKAVHRTRGTVLLTIFAARFSRLEHIEGALKESEMACRGCPQQRYGPCAIGELYIATGRPSIRRPSGRKCSNWTVKRKPCTTWGYLHGYVKARGGHFLPVKGGAPPFRKTQTPLQPGLCCSHR